MNPETQWAALAKLRERGTCLQDHLGPLTAMDVATKGVIDRLTASGCTTARADARRLLVDLTDEGAAHCCAVPIAQAITEKTRERLEARERAMLMGLLRRLA